MSKVQNDIKQTHIGNDNVSGISNNIISSPNMLNNSEKCPIPNKDLLSRKVIGLSFTGSGAGFISCPLFIVSVTGFVTALPISLAILGIGTTAVGLYLLLSGNEVRHNNSDNNISDSMNVLKDENYNNRLFHCNEHNEEINQKDDESKLIKTDTKRNQNINFDENTQNSQIHDHNVNIEQNNGINIKNQSDLTNKDNINNNTSSEVHENAAHDNSIHTENKNNMTELRRESTIDKNIDTVNKNSTNKATINVDNKANENLNTDRVTDIKIYGKITENEKNIKRQSNKLPLKKKKKNNLSYRNGNNNSINIENKNSSNSAEDESIGNNKGNIINKGPSDGTNENLKEIDRTNFKIDNQINDMKNQSTNQTIESNNLIIPGENTNGGTIIDSYTTQGTPPISISGKKNSLREPKESQSYEPTINKNVIKIDKQEFPQKPKDLYEPKPETKQKPGPAEKIPTDFNDQLKSNPVIKPTAGILPEIPTKLENNDKSELQPTEKIFAKLDVIHNNKAGPNPEPKPKEKQELPTKLESPHKLDPEPKPELKPTEEIQIREKFLEYIYHKNNKKNANQKNKQVQGRDAGRANEIPSQIQSKISSIIKDNKNAFRTKKYTNNKDLYKELETISSKLNKLFTEYVLDVTKIKDKDKYTTKQLSDISFKEKNNITKVSCRCQIVKDGKSVFDFEFSAGFVKDWKDVTQKPSNLMHNSVSKFLRPGKFKFTFKDKNNTPRYVNVDFPIAQPAKNNTY